MGCEKLGKGRTTQSQIGSISTPRSPNACRNLVKFRKNSVLNPIVDLIVMRDSKKIYKRMKIFFLGTGICLRGIAESLLTVSESLVCFSGPRNCHVRHRFDWATTPTLTSGLDKPILNRAVEIFPGIHVHEFSQPSPYPQQLWIKGTVADS